MREEVHKIFHEFFDVVAILDAYCATLRTAGRTDATTLQGIEDVAAALRDRAESVRARVFNIVG